MTTLITTPALGIGELHARRLQRQAVPPDRPAADRSRRLAR